MRHLLLALAATAFLVGCSPSSSSSGGSLPPGAAPTLISCFWGTTCDQYSGTIDPTFAANLQTTCGMHGVAYATAACPTANQVAGHCDYGTSNGMNDAYYYYSPTFDTASAKAECQGIVVGATWVP
jgi:hypothetical protein